MAPVPIPFVSRCSWDCRAVRGRCSSGRIPHSRRRIRQTPASGHLSRILRHQHRRPCRFSRRGRPGRKQEPPRERVSGFPASQARHLSQPPLPRQFHHRRTFVPQRRRNRPSAIRILTDGESCQQPPEPPAHLLRDWFRLPPGTTSPISREMLRRCIRSRQLSTAHGRQAARCPAPLCNRDSRSQPSIRMPHRPHRISSTSRASTPPARSSPESLIGSRMLRQG